jgi:hypothetical protein
MPLPSLWGAPIVTRSELRPSWAWSLLMAASTSKGTQGLGVADASGSGSRFG